jgi:hypothetical protein
LQQVTSALERTGWRGELTGNHGAGKSTLLADICAHIRATGRTAIWWQSSDRRRLPPRTWLRDIRQADVIAYDGAERLLPGLLPLLCAITHLMGRGLIVTTHWRHGYGTVIPVKSDARCLAKKFQSCKTPNLEADEWLPKIESALARHDGNSRQVLFDLYIEYEDSARQPLQ